jgi:thioredoxin-like negative regulator of GroEL
VNGLETEFEGRVTFVRLNAEERDVESFQQQLGLRGHPSVGILDSNGNVVERYFGAQSAATIRTVLNRLSISN